MIKFKGEIYESVWGFHGLEPKTNVFGPGQSQPGPAALTCSIEGLVFHFCTKLQIGQFGGGRKDSFRSVIQYRGHGTQIRW